MSESLLSGSNADFKSLQSSQRGSDDEDSDEFVDARDVFESDILKILNVNKGQEEEPPEENAQVTAKKFTLSRVTFYVQIYIHKV